MRTKDNTGSSAIALLVLATALSGLLTIGIPIILAPEPVKVSDWLGFAGSIIGAMVTLIGAAIAWRAVQLQLKLQSQAVSIALISREEDRIEKRLEGLQQARHALWFLIDFYDESRHPAEILNIYSDLGFRHDQTRHEIRDQIKQMIPKASDGVHDIFMYSIVAVISYAKRFIELENDPSEAPVVKSISGVTKTKAEEMRDLRFRIRTSIESLSEYEKYLRTAAYAADETLVKFRKRIESFI